MVIISICVGSSCHLKGSHKIVELMQNAVRDNGYEDRVTLAGSFCTGKCNRNGVTITVNDEIFTGVTPDTFEAFFKEHVQNAAESEER